MATLWWSWQPLCLERSRAWKGSSLSLTLDQMGARTLLVVVEVVVRQAVLLSCTLSSGGALQLHCLLELSMDPLQPRNRLAVGLDRVAYLGMAVQKALMTCDAVWQ